MCIWGNENNSNDVTRDGQGNLAAREALVFIG